MCLWVCKFGVGWQGEERGGRSLLSLPAGRSFFVGVSTPIGVRALGGCTSLGRLLPDVARAKHRLCCPGIADNPFGYAGEAGRVSELQSLRAGWPGQERGGRFLLCPGVGKPYTSNSFVNEGDNPYKAPNLLISEHVCRSIP